MNRLKYILKKQNKTKSKKLKKNQYNNKFLVVRYYQIYYILIIMNIQFMNIYTLTYINIILKLNTPVDILNNF